MEGQYPHAELREHCSHSSGYGQALPVKNWKSCFCPTWPQQHQGPCRGAGPAFGGAEGSKESQAGLAGSGSGHNLAMVRQKAALRKCFFPWIVFNKHLCVRQSNTQPQDQSRHTCRQRAPAHTARPGMLCLKPCTPGSSAGL